MFLTKLQCGLKKCDTNWKQRMFTLKKPFECFSLTTAWRVNCKGREESKLIVDQSVQTRSGQIEQSARDQSNHQDVFDAEPSGNSQEPLSNRLGNANFS